MDSYSEVRRVRKKMSERAGHDIRTLIASINGQWPEEATNAFDPGTKAEQCDTRADWKWLIDKRVEPPPG
ncbi:MAG: hypothetical protein R6U98_35365 [Pirellulaceae bacterium]